MPTCRHLHLLVWSPLWSDLTEAKLKMNAWMHRCGWFLSGITFYKNNSWFHLSDFLGKLLPAHIRTVKSKRKRHPVTILTYYRAGFEWIHVFGFNMVHWPAYGVHDVGDPALRTICVWTNARLNWKVLMYGGVEFCQVLFTGNREGQVLEGFHGSRDLSQIQKD